jgi:DNA polymerase III delta subunit
MKIIILHGDDTQKSYARLKKFIDVARARSWEVSNIDESNQSFEEILSATSLFGSEQFFILKDIKKLSKKEFTWLSKKYTTLSGNLIIYHEGVLGATILKSFPKESKIEEFKLPVLLWNFLDNLAPGRGDYSVRTLHKILEKQPVEFVFSLIARHFRDLYWVKTDSTSTGFPFWKINKLKSQTSLFTADQLKQLISGFSDIDVKVKTSKADLTSELDLLIIKSLE